MDEEKVLNNDEFTGFAGEFSDVVEAVDRVREIICTASKITSEDAKKSLLDGVKIILADCIDAIESRTQTEEPVIEEDD